MSVTPLRPPTDPTERALWAAQAAQQYTAPAPPPPAAPPAQNRPLPPAQVLAATGVPIALLDGTTVNLRYSFASLAALELQFGSIVGVARDIKAKAAAMSADQTEVETDHVTDRPARRGELFTVLGGAIAPGLMHERVIHPDTGQPVRLGADVALLMEYLDPARLSEYADAFGRALQESFGSLGGKADQGTTTPPSPGTSGTTSPVSSPADPTVSSGA